MHVDQSNVGVEGVVGEKIAHLLAAAGGLHPARAAEKQCHLPAQLLVVIDDQDGAGRFCHGTGFSWSCNGR